MHSSGRGSVSAGIPGTGLYVRSDHHGGRSRGAAPGGGVSSAAGQTAGLQRPPGRFARRADRDLYAACVAGDHHRILAVGDLHAATHRQVADVFAAIVGGPPADVVARLLIPLWDIRFDPSEHRFCRRWLCPPVVIGANGGIRDTVALDGEAVGLLAARAASAAGLAADSRRVAGGLADGPLAALARVEAAASDGDWQAAADLADRLVPSGAPADLAIAGWQTEAHRRLGRPAEARKHLEVLQQAARRATAEPPLVSWMLTVRARVAADEGRLAQARKDYVRAGELDPDNAWLNETYEVIVDAEGR